MSVGKASIKRALGTPATEPVKEEKAVAAPKAEAKKPAVKKSTAPKATTKAPTAKKPAA